MISSSCISITLHVEHDTDDELFINDDVALAEMENTIEKKKMEMIGPKKRWKHSLKKHILMVLMRLEWRWEITLCIMNTTFHFLYEKNL